MVILIAHGINLGREGEIMGGGGAGEQTNESLEIGRPSVGFTAYQVHLLHDCSFIN